MSSPTILASDLDRTLVHAASRLAAADADAPVIEIYKGRGITVTRQATLDAIAQLAALGAFVPVTTRSREQLARITPIWAAAQDGWAVCANGAILLHRGERDAAWDAEVARGCAEAASLAEARAIFERELGSPETVDWMPLLRDCDGHFLYCTLDLAAMPADLEPRAQQCFAPLGWRAVLHGRKLYVLPNAICKGRAAAHLRERLGAEQLIAAGDSLLDLELLLEAEQRWVPADAELVELGAVPAGAQLTDAGHVGAGEQIAAAALAQVREALATR